VENLGKTWGKLGGGGFSTSFPQLFHRVFHRLSPVFEADF